jgi:hypothetical protein
MRTNPISLAIALADDLRMERAIENPLHGERMTNGKKTHVDLA